MVVWKVAEAKQGLSQLLEDAQREPQIIHRRHELVGAVLGAQEARAYLEWRRQKEIPALADLIGELRNACVEEGYELLVEPRSDRENPLIEPNLRRRQGARGSDKRPLSRSRGRGK